MLNSSSLEGRLLFAVPKKGRLQSKTLDLLSGSDIQFRRENRLDIALVKNLPIALVFLPAADIPTFVGQGRVDLGITGRDQVAEHEATSPSTQSSGVEEVLDLGFGRCSLRVQVPELGEIAAPAQLVGKTVVTSFTGLTARYFADLEGVSLENGFENRNEAALGRKLSTKITFVGGSVEAACALGVADGIVDLVESGETMRAAGLKDIAMVCDSTAVLIRSKTTSKQALVELLASRIKGVINAQKYILCQYNVPREKLETAVSITPGMRAPSVTSLDMKGWVAVSSMVPKKDLATVMDELTQIGAQDILALTIENSRTI